MAENNEVFDKVLDMLIDEAANIVNEKDGEELKDETKIEFSTEHKEKMKKLFKKAKRDRIGKKLVVYGKRAACVCLVAIVLAGASICSVEAWRAKVLNFFFDEDAPNSDYNFSELGGTHYSDDYISLSYVPWGFEVEKSTITNRGFTLYFINEDSFFIISLKDLDVKSNLDTENAVVEFIDINGYEAICISKEDLNQVIWHNDEYSFYVAGNISKEEIIKIAKYLKKF